ncbi:hypothetical protein Pst134EA_030549 [Puccinia striiformis f. sp. tritici]|uniref:hypothetical protein n=1 Tax=Puccinia striiformis f. sp. tritici TaxID=168172 RepID=UPI00200849DA|nr:hypothetical protein Pst134EA_030549 [Puccinia striiformis f. sp. tritici]KAH9446639.1 hypothetical protein Pst134EA_030549 [Puccinia striiformis f. sp. tritici]KAI9600599.1 hypothetical protein H4Q26_000386 [Puccinia striiformis f. sp. tritici PST-130]
MARMKANNRFYHFVRDCPLQTPIVAEIDSDKRDVEITTKSSNNDPETTVLKQRVLKRS